MSLLLKPVPASHGPRWIVDAFRLYARRPLAFTALFTIFLFAALLVALVPLLGGLVQMMSLPMLSLGFMVASQSALLDGPVHPRQFIEPLRGDAARRRSLLTLCAIYGVAALIILLVADAVSGHAWERLQQLMAKGEMDQVQIDALLSEPGVGLGLVLGTVLVALLSVPFWHAPALVHWGGQGVAQALFSSTLAVWRCRGAFFTYSLAWVGVMLGFGTLAALVLALLGVPQMAGLLGVPAGLVFSAVFYISLLFTFNDSFGGAAAAAAEPPANIRP
ncbi:MAG: BPSS1780 family membrane protein [Rubrivivax sp.]|nr:BPSS1780 family membrane protein [Rubrivivax sp.]